jgi:hypothetical protein
MSVTFPVFVLYLRSHLYCVISVAAILRSGGTRDDRFGHLEPLCNTTPEQAVICSTLQSTPLFALFVSAYVRNSLPLSDGQHFNFTRVYNRQLIHCDPHHISLPVRPTNVYSANCLDTVGAGLAQAV